MKTYQELKKEHETELNNFQGLFFAFDNNQFSEGLKKVNFPFGSTEKVVSIGAGGYILKSRVSDFNNMFKRHKKEVSNLKKDHKQLLNALVYELENHEYCITYDIQDALNALGYKKEDIPAAILREACKIASGSKVDG